MKQQIPVKNYILLLFLFVATIGLVFLLSWCYNVQQNKTSHELQTIFSQITFEEIDSYLMENPDAIIFLTSKDIVVEPNINQLILDKEILERFVAINCTNITPDFAKYTKKSVGAPGFIVFKDGKVEDIMYEKEKSLNYKNTYNFLLKNKVIAND